LEKTIHYQGRWIPASAFDYKIAFYLD
jgi:hypothetical protein